MKETLWSSGNPIKRCVWTKEHARPGIGPPARAFKSYALHKVYEFVESITREGNFVEFWQSTQKDASGPKEHARHGFGPPARRV